MADGPGQRRASVEIPGFGDLDVIPRVPLGQFPTPLHQSQSLGSLLGADNLWIKRDDLTGFMWGGNKVRTAEYLLGQAESLGATELVVSGGPTSNFVAVMAAAARAHGLPLHRVTYGSEYTGTAAAFEAARQSGATVTFTGSPDRNEMDRIGRRLAADRRDFGQRAFAIPRGGATDVGALGFLFAHFELLEQVEQAGFSPTAVVIPVGSGGSIAGLLAGAAISQSPWRLTGASVSRPPRQIIGIVTTKAIRCAALLGIELTEASVKERLEIYDTRQPGFGQASSAQAKLAERIRQSTGLFVDPTYNAKAMHWMATTEKAAGTHTPIVYWHTGGILSAIDDLCRTASTQTQIQSPTNRTEQLS